MRHLLHRQKMDGSLARISPLVFCFAMKGQCRGGWGGEFLASPPSPTKRKSSLFHVMVQRITCLGRLLVFPHQTLSFFVDCVFMTNQKWTGVILSSGQNRMCLLRVRKGSELPVRLATWRPYRRRGQLPMHVRENTHNMIDAYLNDGLLKTQVDIMLNGM